MFRLENIQYLYALIAIPLLVVIFIWMRNWRKKAIAKMGDKNVVQQLMTDVSTLKPVWKFIFATLALTLLIIAIVNPQIGSKLQDVKRTGADVIIALDVSNSMKAEDLAPNRLERAKQAIAKMTDKLEGDRLGIIVFAGDAFVQLPITSDYSAAKLFLDNINTDIIPAQGTAIGTAIRLGIESFGKDVGKNKSIIVITDGENHEDDAIAAAKEAVEKNITINTIGLGSTEGSPIPLIAGNPQAGFKKDKDGATVITKLNEEMLLELASVGNGIYVHATNSETGLNTILEEIGKLEKKEFEGKTFSDYDDKFYWFLYPALFFLLLELLIDERISKWWLQLNLFGDKK